MYGPVGGVDAQRQENMQHRHRQLAFFGFIGPLILPQSGVEPFFKGMPDQKFQIDDHRILDGEVVLLDYRPDGGPHYA